MRKLMITVILALITLVSFSQNQSVDRTLGYDDTYILFSGTSSDYVLDEDSTWSYTIEKKTDNEVKAYYRLDLDSISGTAEDVNIYFQNKLFEDDDFTDVDTVVYSGSADTTIYFNYSSNLSGDFHRVLVSKNDNDFKVLIKYLKAKFYK